jgi:APA family basic amino acid/polyamine antiporter
MAYKLFRTKSLALLMSETEREGRRLRRVLTAWDLTAIGIGCIIGVGIFVLPGVEAAKHAGPGIILSFAVAAAACACSALCYAELAAMLPVSGSAYTYGYACLGEIFAWIIGWDLVLEYMVGASLVAIGWSAYLANLLKGMGLELPSVLTAPPFAEHPGLLDLPAALIVLAISYLLVRGIKESSRVNLTVVVIKVSVILVFIALTAWYVHPANWVPFAPFGWKGIMTAAAIVFLAYIGFDAVSTTAEEARNPQRDLPIGIIASLVVATLLYMAVAAIMTGVVPYRKLGVADPIALVLNVLHMRWASALISVGALAGITSVLLVLLMGQPRILFAMSRDGLLPEALSKVHARFRTPYVTTWITGAIVAVSAALTPINVVAELCSIGTLFAFIIVCAGVIVLRFTRRDMVRPFRAPLTPLLPALGILLCGYLMLSLPLITWLRFLVWLLVGLAIYGGYGFRHSGLNGEIRPAGVEGPLRQARNPAR